MAEDFPEVAARLEGDGLLLAPVRGVAEVGSFAVWAGVAAGRLPLRGGAVTLLAGAAATWVGPGNGLPGEAAFRMAEAVSARTETAACCAGALVPAGPTGGAGGLRCLP